MGAPKILIMMMVRNERKYGYEIIKEMREIFDGIWEPQTGFVYPLIKKMQEKGLLDSEMIDNKEYYGLTDSGRILLTETLPRVGSMFSMAARFMTLVNKTVDDLGIELMDLNTIFDNVDRDRKAHLIDVRDHLRAELERVEEKIRTIEG